MPQEETDAQIYLPPEELKRPAAFDRLKEALARLKNSRKKPSRPELYPSSATAEDGLDADQNFHEQAQRLNAVLFHIRDVLTLNFLKGSQIEVGEKIRRAQHFGLPKYVELVLQKNPIGIANFLEETTDERIKDRSQGIDSPLNQLIKQLSEVYSALAKLEQIYKARENETSSLGVLWQVNVVSRAGTLAEDLFSTSIINELVRMAHTSRHHNQWPFLPSLVNCIEKAISLVPPQNREQLLTKESVQRLEWLIQSFMNGEIVGAHHLMGEQLVSILMHPAIAQLPEFVALTRRLLLDRAHSRPKPKG